MSAVSEVTEFIRHLVNISKDPYLRRTGWKKLLSPDEDDFLSLSDGSHHLLSDEVRDDIRGFLGRPFPRRYRGIKIQPPTKLRRRVSLPSIKNTTKKKFPRITRRQSFCGGDLPPLTMLDDLRTFFEGHLADETWSMSNAERREADVELLRRESVKFHPDIVAVIQQFWRVTDADGNGRLDHREYCALNRLFYRVLHEQWDDRNADKCAEEDWNFDRQGLDYVERQRFRLGIFQLVDLWTESTDPKDYSLFLTALLQAVSEEDFREKGHRHFRRVNEVIEGCIAKKNDHKRPSSPDKHRSHLSTTVPASGAYTPTGPEEKKEKARRVTAIVEQVYVRLLGKKWLIKKLTSDQQPKRKLRGWELLRALFWHDLGGASQLRWLAQTSGASAPSQGCDTPIMSNAVSIKSFKLNSSTGGNSLTVQARQHHQNLHHSNKKSAVPVVSMHFDSGSHTPLGFRSRSNSVVELNNKGPESSSLTSATNLTENLRARLSSPYNSSSHLGPSNTATPVARSPVARSPNTSRRPSISIVVIGENSPHDNNNLSSMAAMKKGISATQLNTKLAQSLPRSSPSPLQSARGASPMQQQHSTTSQSLPMILTPRVNNNSGNHSPHHAHSPLPLNAGDGSGQASLIYDFRAALLNGFSGSSTPETISTSASTITSMANLETPASASCINLNHTGPGTGTGAGGAGPNSLSSHLHFTCSATTGPGPPGPGLTFIVTDENQAKKEAAEESQVSMKEESPPVLMKVGQEQLTTMTTMSVSSEKNQPMNAPENSHSMVMMKITVDEESVEGIKEEGDCGVKRQGVTQPRPKTAKARRSMPRLSVDITNTIGEEKSSSRSPSIVSSHDMEQSLRRLKLSTAFLGKLDRRPSSCPTNISSSSNEAQCEMASAAVVIQKTDSDVQTSARPRFREGQLIGQPLIPRFSKEQAQYLTSPVRKVITTPLAVSITTPSLSSCTTPLRPSSAASLHTSSSSPSFRPPSTGRTIQQRPQSSPINRSRPATPLSASSKRLQSARSLSSLLLSPSLSQSPSLGIFPMPRSPSATSIASGFAPSTTSKRSPASVCSTRSVPGTAAVLEDPATTYSYSSIASCSSDLCAASVPAVLTLKEWRRLNATRKSTSSLSDKVKSIPNEVSVSSSRQSSGTPPRRVWASVSGAHMIPRFWFAV